MFIRSIYKSTYTFRHTHTHPHTHGSTHKNKIIILTLPFVVDWNSYIEWVGRRENHIRIKSNWINSPQFVSVIIAHKNHSKLFASVQLVCQIEKWLHDPSRNHSINYEHSTWIYQSSVHLHATLSYIYCEHHLIQHRTCTV